MTNAARGSKMVSHWLLRPHTRWGINGMPKHNANGFPRNILICEQHIYDLSNVTRWWLLSDCCMIWKLLSEMLKICWMSLCVAGVRCGRCARCVLCDFYVLCVFLDFMWFHHTRNHRNRRNLIEKMMIFQKNINDLSRNIHDLARQY